MHIFNEICRYLINSFRRFLVHATSLRDESNFINATHEETDTEIY